MVTLAFSAPPPPPPSGIPAHQLVWDVSIARGLFQLLSDNWPNSSATHISRREVAIRHEIDPISGRNTINLECARARGLAQQEGAESEIKDIDRALATSNRSHCGLRTRDFEV